RLVASQAPAVSQGARTPQARRPWPLKGKLWLTLGLMWLVMIGFVISMAWQSRATRFEERQHSHSNTIGMVDTLLEGYAT
ncbi:hypothetical protein CVH10_24080, partial [Halomonas sp. ND22Bw]